MTLDEKADVPASVQCSTRSNAMNPKLMTFKDFAGHIGVSYSTVRRMVAEKKIRVVRPRRRPMIPASEIAKFTFPVVIVVDEL
jgi:excisionase family DNA binding protein